jgi:uncharacterized protein YegP (UPF0339 family)
MHMINPRFSDRREEVMYFEKYQQLSQWRWRLRAANHEIIASGESYWNETDCDHAINLVKGTTSSTPVRKL